MSDDRLPRLAERLLRLTLPSDWRDDIIAELEPAYATRHARSVWRARVWLAWQVVAFSVRFGMERLGAGRRVADSEDDFRGANSEAPTRFALRILADRLAQDLRFAVRSLRRSPGFAFTAVGTLAVGIAAAAAMFSLVDAVLLAPLPYPEADRLVQVWEVSPDGDPKSRLSRATQLAWSRAARSLDGPAAYRTGRTLTLTGQGNPDLITVAEIEPAVSSLLGVQAELGRTFLEGDGLDGERLVLLSHSFWEGRLGSDPSIVGSTLTLDQGPYTVVGIMPREFTFPDEKVDAWVSLTPDTPGTDAGNWSLRTLLAVARLEPGASLEEARSEISTLAALREQPGTEGWGADLVPLQVELTSDVRVLLSLLLGGVGFVLLGACGNLANLQLARAAGREREIAVRGALGAAKGRIVTQLITESLLLAALGGAAAVALAPVLLDVFTAIAPAGVPLMSRASIDHRSMALTLLLSGFCALVFGLAPAMYQAGTSSAHTLRSSRGATPRGHTGVRSALLVLQVSLAVVLTIGAGLLIRTSAALTSADLGFDQNDLATLSLTLPDRTHPTVEDQARFAAALQARVGEISGVVAAAVATRAPGIPGTIGFSFQIEGRPASTSTGLEEPEDTRWIGPGYFSTIGQPLLRGREFEASDEPDAPPVAIVNQSLARKLWPDDGPVGQRIALSDEEGRWRQIVGVVGDARLSGPDESATPRLYLPYAQHTQQWAASFTVLARTEQGRSLGSVQTSLRETLLALDPSLPPRELGSVEARYARVAGQRRFAMALAVAFGIAAVALAMLGMYGLISYWVAARRGEFGLRLALGAKRGDVILDVMRQALRLTAIGVILGGIAALTLTRGLESLLFSVTPADATTYSFAALMIFLLAAAAAGVPGWRASRTEPVTTLTGD